MLLITVSFIGIGVNQTALPANLMKRRSYVTSLYYINYILVSLRTGIAT